MKSANETVEYIEQITLAAQARPKMYVSSPVALEEIFSWFDKLRSFILSPDITSESRRDGYTGYLISRGCGSASYCHRKETDGEPLPSFEEVVAVFHDYTKSGYYLHRDADKDTSS